MRDVRFVIFDPLITYDELKALVGIEIGSIEDNVAYFNTDILTEHEITSRVRAFEKDVISERRDELDKRRAAESMERFERWLSEHPIGEAVEE